jgi:hypothetical protein
VEWEERTGLLSPHHLYVCAVSSAAAAPAQVAPAPMPLSQEMQALQLQSEAAAKSSQSFLVCYVNGKRHQLLAEDIRPESTLLQFIRESQ